MSTKTFTTAAGATYSYEIETGEHGEAVYNLSRVFQSGALPVGAIVVHPDYNLDPAVPGLLNIQFGKSGADSYDRHDRTEVPMLGGEHDTYVIGHQLINPADLDAKADPETGEITDPKITFTRSVRAASTATGTASIRATRETFHKVQDLITALVKEYRADKATPKREAQYAAFLNAQRAEKIQPELDAIDAQIKALMFRKAELTEKLNGYKTA
ncbi:hypothetical protein ACFY1P_32895 [Streptomyces sp. NPDC001407]|uniref:hypothetical protein n=1 Tax=Streptomyces sp. NPDC001407 TaxID=3364573 RepID=UPI0036987ED0